MKQKNKHPRELFSDIVKSLNIQSVIDSLPDAFVADLLNYFDKVDTLEQLIIFRLVKALQNDDDKIAMVACEKLKEFLYGKTSQEVENQDDDLKNYNITINM